MRFDVSGEGLRVKYSTSVGFLIFAAAAAGTPIASVSEGASDVEEMVLPKGLKRYLARRLPDFTPITSKDYEAEDLKYFDLSWMLKADFNGDGRVDTCLLLKGPSERVSLAVFHKCRFGYAHFILADDLGGMPNHTTLALAGPGRLRDTAGDDPEPSFVVLQNPGIVEGLLETCHEMLYYWSGDEYVSAYRGI
jgi:hypothetical protein